MSYLLKVAAFAAFTMAYFMSLTYFAGGMASASVCHYPGVPGCRTSLLPVSSLLIVALAVYAGLFRLFRRSTRSDRQGYDS